jgi:hypothetical protein
MMGDVFHFLSSDRRVPVDAISADVGLCPTSYRDQKPLAV